MGFQEFFRNLQPQWS